MADIKLGSCEKCFHNFWLHAIIIVLLVVLIIRLEMKHMSEALDYTYLGNGLADTVYTSGATLRRLGTTFSSTDQGHRSTIYNAEIKDTLKRERDGLDVVMFPADRVPANMIGNI